MQAFRSIAVLFAVVALAACGSSQEPEPGEAQLTLQLSSPDVRVEAGQQAVIQLIALGARKEVTFSVEGLPGYATLDGDQIRLAPQRQDVGEAVLTITATAGKDSDTKQLHVIVTRANAVPQFSYMYLLDEDGRYLFASNAEGVIARGTPYLYVEVNEADLDGVQLLAEVVPDGTPFTGVPTHSSSLSPGNQAKVYLNLVLPGLEAQVRYRVQAWVRDAYGAETRRSELGPVIWSPRPPRSTAPDLRTCEGVSVEVSSDTHHCGACGHDCRGASCQAGLCAAEEVIPANSMLYNASNLAAGAGYVYVSRSGFGGGILRVPALEGAPEQRTDTPASLMLAAGASLYFIGNLNVLQYMPSWSEPVTTAVYDMPVADSLKLHLQGGWLYWVSQSGRVHSLVRAPAVGGALAEKLAEVPFSLAMAVDASGGYVATETGVILRFPLESSPALTPFVRDLQGVRALALDAEYLYVAYGACGFCASPSTIARVPKSGGTLEVLATSPVSVHDLRVDDRFLYWANHARTSDLPLTQGTLMRLPREGGTPQVLADGFDQVYRMVIEGPYAWWLSREGGLYRVAR